MRIMPNIKLTEEVYRQIATQNKIEKNRLISQKIARKGVE